MNKVYKIIIFLVGLMLAACSIPFSPQTAISTQMYTAAAQTAYSEFTREASFTYTPQPTSSLVKLTVSQSPPLPTATLNAVIPTFPVVTPLPPICERAAIVNENNTADRIFSLAEPFVKIWKLKNDGTCTWKAGYKFVLDSGNSMGAEQSTDLSKPVAPGDSIDISLTMRSPFLPGTYIGLWKVQNPAGKRFGSGLEASDPFKVQIQVAGTVTP